MANATGNATNATVTPAPPVTPNPALARALEYSTPAPTPASKEPARILMGTVGGSGIMVLCLMIGIGLWMRQYVLKLERRNQSNAPELVTRRIQDEIDRDANHRERRKIERKLAAQLGDAETVLAHMREQQKELAEEYEEMVFHRVTVEKEDPDTIGLPPRQREIRKKIRQLRERIQEAETHKKEHIRVREKQEVRELHDKVRRQMEKAQYAADPFGLGDLLEPDQGLFRENSAEEERRGGKGKRTGSAQKPSPLQPAQLGGRTASQPADSFRTGRPRRGRPAEDDTQDMDESLIMSMSLLAQSKALQEATRDADAERGPQADVGNMSAASDTLNTIVDRVRQGWGDDGAAEQKDAEERRKQQEAAALSIAVGRLQAKGQQLPGAASRPPRRRGSRVAAV